MNNLHAVTTAVLRGDKRKTPSTIALRLVTLEEIPLLLGGPYARREFWTLDREGKATAIRTNGGLKQWKKDPQRFEQSFKYGMYENFRWTTQQMLSELYVEA